jgi:hypothetical protein
MDGTVKKLFFLESDAWSQIGHGHATRPLAN